MLKVLKIIPIAWILLWGGCVQAASSVAWGVRVEQVKQLETRVLLEEKAYMLTYQASFGGEDYQLEYLFNKENGTLEEKLYYRTLKPVDSECQQEYRRVLAILREMHGEPDDKSEGSAACHAKLKHQWLVGSGDQIALQLDSWKGHPYIGIRYKPNF